MFLFCLLLKRRIETFTATFLFFRLLFTTISLFLSDLFLRYASHYELKVNTFAILSSPQKETKQEIKCRSCWFGSRLTGEFVAEKISAEWLVRKWCTCYCWYMSFHKSTFCSFGLWKWGRKKIMYIMNAWKRIGNKFEWKWRCKARRANNESLNDHIFFFVYFFCFPHLA